MAVVSQHLTLCLPAVLVQHWAGLGCLSLSAMHSFSLTHSLSLSLALTLPTTPLSSFWSPCQCPEVLCLWLGPNHFLSLRVRELSRSINLSKTDSDSPPLVCFVWSPIFILGDFWLMMTSFGSCYPAFPATPQGLQPIVPVCHLPLSNKIEKNWVNIFWVTILTADIFLSKTKYFYRLSSTYFPPVPYPQGALYIVVIANFRIWGPSLHEQ